MSIPKIYFNVYLAGVIKMRPDNELINTDLLYFCLLMKANFFAKETYAMRINNQPEEDVKDIYSRLQRIRQFMMDFFDVPAPNWNLIQNELEDDLEELKRLPDDLEPKISASGARVVSRDDSRERVRTEADLGSSGEEKVDVDPNHLSAQLSESVLTE